MSEDYPWRDRDTMKRLYVDEDMTAPEVADELGCVTGTAEKWLSVHGLWGTNGKDRCPEFDDPEWLREQYVEQGRSMQEIADELGCGPGTVNTHIHRHGIEARRQGETGPQVDPRLGDADLLREWYEDEGLGGREIADRVGCCQATAFYWLRRAGIEVREPPIGVPRYGEDHPSYKGGHTPKYGPGWKRAREAALDRDGRCCVTCGMSEEESLEEWGKSLDVHHVQRKGSFVLPDGSTDYESAHALDNLVTLCRRCHGTWEWIPLRPVRHAD